MLYRRAILSLILLAAGPSFAADPTFLKIKVYKMSVSTSPLCTGLTTVIDNGDSAEHSDVLLSPTLGSGSVANGTYPCVVIEMSDLIKYASSTTTGSCTAGTEVTLSVCPSGDSSTLIDGTSTSCTSGEDRVAMYLSTASTATTGDSGHNAFVPPTALSDATKGFKLANELVVAGASSGKFVVNGTGKIDGSGGTCEMNPPLFSFSKVE